MKGHGEGKGGQCNWEERREFDTERERGEINNTEDVWKGQKETFL